MGLKNLFAWGHKAQNTAPSSGTACGAQENRDKPSPKYTHSGAGDRKPSACGSACGAGDPKPSACGSACGAGDPKPSACGSACGAGDKK